MTENIALKKDLDEDAEELGKPNDSEDASIDDDSANVGDPSVEINVEELISELETNGLVSALDGEQEARRRLEELMERKRANRDLEDFDD